MDKVLVIKRTYFLDGHGTPDLGGVEKFLADEGEYKTTPDDMFEKHDELIPYDEAGGCEDGYNSEVYDYTVKKLTPEKLKKVKEILKEYDKL